VANKLSAVMEKIETGLAGIVNPDSGPVKRLYRRLIVPSKALEMPAVALWFDAIRRSEKRIWTGDAIVQLVALTGTDDADTAVLDLVARLDAAIQAVADSGSSGGGIDQPSWDLWYMPGADEFVRVGAVGRFRVTVEAPLAA